MITTNMLDYARRIGRGREREREDGDMVNMWPGGDLRTTVVEVTHGEQRETIVTSESVE